MKRILRGYRDRDYLLTQEEFFFCVVGMVHPRDRVIAYMKYAQNPTGKWHKGRKRFKRVLPHYTMPNLLETFKLLEAFPHYLYNSSALNVKMSAVPLDCILSHYKPEEKVRQLLKSEELDPLQQKVINLLKILSDESNITLDYFGVTGSVLLDIHQAFSDIDLLIYGVKNILAVKKGLLQLYAKSDSPISRYKEKTFKEWCIQKTKKYQLTYAEAATICKRKWGRGLFSKTNFSVHPIKLDEDVSEKYGERVFHPKGIVKIEATVSDNSESSFLPSIYEVEDVKFLEGSEVDDVFEAASYDGFFSDIAKKNERIIVKGKLERVNVQRREEEYHRVLVGSPEAKGNDYIKLTDES